MRVGGCGDTYPAVGRRLEGQQTKGANKIDAIVALAMAGLVGVRRQAAFASYGVVLIVCSIVIEI